MEQVEVISIDIRPEGTFVTYLGGGVDQLLPREIKVDGVRIDNPEAWDRIKQGEGMS